MIPRTIIAAASSLASVALAQNTQIKFEGSYDQGQTWQSGTMPYSPGATLEVRARISLIHAGTTTVLGLAGLTFTPTLTNFIPAQGDTVLPFSTPDGTGVPEDPQSGLGRVVPFSSSDMSTGSASDMLTHFVETGNLLRFAGANYRPNSTIFWGVSCGQVPMVLAGTSFRPGTDAVVFRYAVQLNSAAVAGEWVASVGLNDILNTRASWYRVPVGASSLLAPVTQDTIVPLRILIPAPATCAIALFVCAAARRRRHI